MNGEIVCVVYERLTFIINGSYWKSGVRNRLRNLSGYQLKAQMKGKVAIKQHIDNWELITK